MSDRRCVSLLVILPTFNERPNLEPMVGALLRECRGCRILVVDGQSPDGTGEVADTLARRHSGRVAVLHREAGEGLAAAHRAAFEHALVVDGAEAVVLMDCDFSHDPVAVPHLVEALAEADLVIGSRCVAGGGEVGRGPLRRGLTRGGNLVASMLLRRCGVRDMTAGFFAFRRSALAAILPRLRRSRGFASSIELKWIASHLGLRQSEVPVTFRERRAGASKLSLSILGEALLQVVSMSLRPPPDPAPLSEGQAHRETGQGSPR